MDRNKLEELVLSLYEVDMNAMKKATNKQLASIILQGDKEALQLDGVRILNDDERKHLRGVK